MKYPPRGLGLFVFHLRALCFFPRLLGSPRARRVISRVVTLDGRAYNDRAVPTRRYHDGRRASFHPTLETAYSYTTATARLSVCLS